MMLAIWLGLFMAVLMPLHANSHCHGTAISSVTASVSEPYGGILDHPDLCSICKALSHLAAVSWQGGTIEVHRTPIIASAEQVSLPRSLDIHSLSPRSPPLV